MTSIAATQQSLQSLIKQTSGGITKGKSIDDLVDEELRKIKTSRLAESNRSMLEYVLKDDIFTLAAAEGTALKNDQSDYYDALKHRLDLILTFTEHGACEPTFPFTILQDLLEAQTIASCSHIFSWIESRATRLTKGMVPQKGKALVLLRTLNDLLRRLSKMGPTTIFCGRILTFLSGVFPLGERSGVNLRGEYGPIWEGAPEAERKADNARPSTVEIPESSDDKMQVDESQGEAEVKKSDQEVKDQTDDFYSVFWSLQLPFSRPPLFAAPGTFARFKDAVEKVMPVIKEATTKERAMMGSRSATGTAGNLKRKREAEVVEETHNQDYFFAKFLTSPELLDLEIADLYFRRQFLFQLLILLNHLLSFTSTAKAAWASMRNRSLQMDFTLEPADAQWVQDTIVRVSAELRVTTPNGPIFADTVNIILEREKNWVRWKNELCAPFDREPWYAEVDGKKVGVEDATRQARADKRQPPKEWPWAYGSQSLTEIWELGYRDLNDLRNPFQPGDVQDFMKKVKQEDARIEMRRKTLARTAERIAQGRTKAAAGAASSSLPATSPPLTQETPAPLASPPAAATSRPVSISSPLHPSLPAKPVTTPSKPPSAPDVKSQPPVPAPAPVPSQAAALAPVPAPSPAPPAVVDEQITKFEENKQRWSWLALRTARDQHLQLFGKIGTGDIVLLAQEIEAEKEREKEREKEKARKPEDMSSALLAGSGASGQGDEPNQCSPMIVVGDDGANKPIANDTVPEEEAAPEAHAAEVDVKMEER